MDEADEPLPDIIIELTKGPDEAIRTKSDAYGQVRFDGLVPGCYSIRLPHTDVRAWERIATATLGAAALSSGEAKWAPPSAQRQPESYEVVFGDCVESIAFRHGFLPETVWSYGENGPFVGPVDETSGLQERLRNLGYYCGAADGVFNQRTAAALKLFQLESGLPSTGKLDAATKSKLIARFGS